MATPYETIYVQFSQKITDYKLASLSDLDLKATLHGWLISAIPKFPKCIHSLKDRDDTSMQFNTDLVDEEIEILACLMVHEWLQPQINSIVNILQFFGGKEEKFFAQSQHLSELRGLRKDNNAETSKLKSAYSNTYSDYLKS